MFPSHEKHPYLGENGRRYFFMVDDMQNSI